MTNGTQLWPGDRMRAFFRAHIRRETSLDDAGAERLAEALTKVVNRMLVWDMPAVVADDASRVIDSGGLKPKRATPDSSAAAVFNPFAFSATVMLAKQGADGLMKRLAEIKNAEHLRALANAQHLAVDAAIAKPDALRRAIVAAAEQRLADRKAAAS